MERHGYLTVEERARITDIQDSLIDRYVEQKAAIKEGNRRRAIELEHEIAELLRRKNRIKHWATFDPRRLTTGPARAQGKLIRARV